MEIVDVRKEVLEEVELPRIEGKQTDRQRDGQRNTDGYEIISTGVELVTFLKKNGTDFQMNEQEADLICEYMDGHGYVVGQWDGQIFRSDLCAETDRMVWEKTSIDDLVDCATEWNYEMLQEAGADMEKPDNFSDFKTKHSRYEKLCADEKVLDGMFDRTKYADMIEWIAQSLAEQLIQSLQSKGDIDSAVKELVQGVKGGQEEKQKGRLK